MGRIVVWLAVVLVLLTVLVLELAQREGSVVHTFLYYGGVTKDLTVANVSMTPDKSPEVTRQKMATIVEQIIDKNSDVDLIVFGETILSWFRAKDNEYHREIAEPIPGPSTDYLSDIARQHGVNIAFGMSENADGTIYNSQVFVDRSGDILQKQRKKNLRSTYFTPSTDSIAFVEFEGVKAGMVICYDMRFGDAMAKTKAEEADMIILSNADYMDTWDHAYFGYKYLALRYGAWVISGNRYGIEYGTNWGGHIEVMSPLGEVIDSWTGQERYMINTIQLNTEQSKLKRQIRSMISYLSIGYLIIKHPKIALGYI